ncbi:MAG: T9SS type A sorting domain-containing protein [Candidatus Eisenbacteria bacterium]
MSTTRARLRGTLAALSILVPTAAPAWSPPAVPAPGIEALGDPSLYGAEHGRALDPVYDVRSDAGGGDLMAFYYDQNTDRLVFRAQVKDLGSYDGKTNRMRDSGVRLYVALDYLEGGTTALPDGIAGESPIAWDRVLRLGYEGGDLRAALLDDSMNPSETERIKSALVTSRHHMVEGEIWLPGGFEEAALAAAGKSGVSYETIAPSLAARDATPVRFYVFTARGEEMIDDIVTDNGALAGDHNVAFMVHGNQGLTWTTVFYGERGENAAGPGDPANPDDGFDEILDAHRYYQIPLNMHLAGQLQTAAEWHNPEFNDSMAAAVSNGWGDIITSAYAQHMMPFVQDDMNDWAVNIEKVMSDWRYGDTATVAWVPERVWLENPDNDGNGIAADGGVVDNTLLDDWLPHGVRAVMLDDYIHLDYYNNVFDDRHIYIHSSGLKFIPMDGDFVGNMDNDWGSAWNMIIGLSSDEILVYGNDWEIPSEVSQGASNAWALNNWINVLQQCSINSGTVAVWKLSDAIHHGAFLRSNNPTIQNGTYGLLGGKWGYGGGNNSWYIDWAAYDDPQHVWDFHVPTWDYGTIWNNTYNKIMGSPANDLSETAWYVMMTNLHETGWHDNGEISGWIYRYSNHIKNANVYAEASRWANGDYPAATGAYLSDIDEDGEDEGVIYNENLFAVIEPIGGRIVYLFAQEAGDEYSVIGNCNVYWADTEGDYNEGNHTGGLSDVSVAGLDREHDTYSIDVVAGSGGTVTLDLVHPNVKKRLNLTSGAKHIGVIYDAGGQDVYMKSGFSPDLLDLIWNAESDRIWAATPAAGAYFGQRNPNSGATAAMVVGGGGARFNLQYNSTLLGVDEIFGSGQFEVYLFAGETAPPDGNGNVAELQALATALTDTLAPGAISATYFPTPDRISIRFNEVVKYDQVTVTGFSVDDDDDGAADVTFSAGCSVRTVNNSVRIDIDLDASTAAAIDALSPNTLELMLAANTVRDEAGNGNDAQDHTDDIQITVAPATMITIDGYFDPGEWTSAMRVVNDDWDSQWTTPAPGDTNDINGLWMTWDGTFLYLGIEGMVHGNSWLLYLDTNPGGSAGESDLDSIDHWERGAHLPFPADFQYGCYQHQGPFDSDSFWKITSDTTTQDFSGSIVSAFDSPHFYGTEGGSEMAIPWDVIYGLGAGNVPPGASISLVASITWDPEPDGELGGDQAPDNISATAPDLDNYVTLTVDGNGDGLPDATNEPVGVARGDGGPMAAPLALLGNAPNPFNAATTIRFTVPGRAGTAAHAAVDVFDLTGRRVKTLVDEPVPAGYRTAFWNGTDARGAAVASGIYFVRLRAGGETATRKITLIR